MPRSIERVRQRIKVLKAIERRPVTGFTCDQLEVKLGMLHQTVSARIAELSSEWKIFPDGGRRKTRTGRPAWVWKPARKCGVGRPRK